MEKEKRNWPKEAKGKEELLLFPSEPKEHYVLMGSQTSIYRVRRKDLSLY